MFKGVPAPTPSSPRSRPPSSPRRRASATIPPVPGRHDDDRGPRPLVAVAGRRRPDHRTRRRRPTPPRRPLRRDAAPAARGHAARLRHPATPAQRRLGRAPAQSPAPAPPAAGPRPDRDPRPRPAVPRPPGDPPRPGQGRHQPLPRLRHRPCRPPRTALHWCPDRRRHGRAAQGRDPRPAAPGGADRRPAAVAPGGSRVLQRGGGPLPPGGAGPVADAGGLPRPLAPAARWPDRQLRLPDLEDERFVDRHADRREAADRDGVALCAGPHLALAGEIHRGAR